ncbi:Clavaminate synthase-like protein [Marasmius fiardii PR-910]|nr:Clavaminate synthase-like protein [Marasmius fiardii PR-910]
MVPAELENWLPPPETHAELDWAPLLNLDLSRFDSPGGKESLAAELKDAATSWGFWTVINSGIPQALVDRHFAIANTFFNQSVDEKKKVVTDYVGGGSHFGYREPRVMELGHEVGGKKLKVMQNVEMLKYHPRSEDDDQKVKDTWLGGHTDFGSLTLLFSQPVAALQILAPSNEWKWVKPVTGGIICNAADVMSFLTKGYIKSSIHRVVRPPPDQAHLHRISLVYFLRPGNDVPMIPAPSPVLLREGLIGKGDDNENEVVTGYEYVRARAGYFNTRKTWKVDQKGEAEESVFKVKHLSVRDYYV